MSGPVPTCPHCGSRLKRWRVPEGATWSEGFFLVCFDDECSYYLEGCAWMMQEYAQKASYRYALNPTTGGSLALPVWSASAIREMIIDEPEHGEGDHDE